MRVIDSIHEKREAILILLRGILTEISKKCVSKRQNSIHRLWIYGLILHQIKATWYEGNRSIVPRYLNTDDPEDKLSDPELEQLLGDCIERISTEEIGAGSEIKAEVDAIIFRIEEITSSR